MKKIYLSLSLVLMSLAGFAQLSIIDADNGLPAATSYTYEVTPGSPTFTSHFDIHNNSGSPITVRSKRYLITNTSGQEPYYCFGTLCFSYTSNAFYSPTHTSVIAAGGSIPNGQGTYGLAPYFDDFMTYGVSKALYVIYDVNNVNDSVAVEITYEVNAVGLSKIDAKNFNMSNPMPNPSANAVSVKYNFNALPKTSSIKVYNMVGVMVKEIKVEGVEGKAQFDVSNLTDGVYFYSLTVNDKVVSTKRLIVSK
ncbi:MAG: Secretion system C-terminal sorting domain [Bacteroidetes bacterium]|jgi:hypothetical protein|nr:Secretion system C-terminal sorting domain [Bacteroidota bacterium]